MLRLHHFLFSLLEQILTLSSFDSIAQSPISNVNSLTIQILSILSALGPSPSSSSTNSLIELQLRLSSSALSRGYPIHIFRSLVQRILSTLAREMSSCLEMETGRKVELEIESKAKGKGKETSTGKGRPEKSMFDEAKVPFHCRSQILKNGGRVLDVFWKANGGEGNGSDVANEEGTRDLTRTLFSPRIETLDYSEFYLPISDLLPILQDFRLHESLVYASRSSSSLTSDYPDVFALASHPYLLTLGSKSKVFEHAIRRSLWYNEKTKLKTDWSASRRTGKVDEAEEDQEKSQERDSFQSEEPNESGADPNASETLSKNGRILIQIRRDFLLEDSKSELIKVFTSMGWNVSQSLKELEIKFEGEEGFDAGGLKKEWFILLSEELSKSGNEHSDLGADDPSSEADIPLFVKEDHSEQDATDPIPYINPRASSRESFELLGKVLALALIHGQLLGIRLPEVLIRFMVSQEEKEEDSGSKLKSAHQALILLKEVSPTITRSLAKVLNWYSSQIARPEETEKAFQEAFGLSWTWSRSHDGIEVHELKENGKDLIVKFQEKEEFVIKVINYLLIDSVLPQLLSIRRGFQTILPLGKSSNNPLITSLSLFSASEFSTLFSGSLSPLEVAELRTNSTSHNFRKHDARDMKLLNDFWKVLEDLDENERREAWRFVTGVNRLPSIGRGAGIELVAMGEWNDGDGDEGEKIVSKRLPTSSTCTNTIFLNRSGNYRSLKRDLELAVRGSRGFGLM